MVGFSCRAGRGQWKPDGSQNALAVEVKKPRLGSALPSLSCDAPWLGGAPPDDAQLAGRPVAVHFFSSDCPLCDQGAHRIARWISEFAAQDLVVVGAFQPRRDRPSTDDSARIECARQIRVAPHPCAVDVRGELAERFGNEWWPGYYVYDRAHRLRHVQTGNAALDLLDRAVAECVVSATPRGSRG